MDIMELAAALGKAIKADDRIAQMNAATAAYEENKALQAMVAEYNAQTAALTEEYKKPDKAQDVIDAVQTRINTLYEAITQDPTLVAYQAANDAVNALMNEVNGEITFQITGERPCAHDCASCSSGCSHNHS